jgi:hypothetical protein
MRLDPDPKLTESNQKSEFWIGSGSDPTKNMVWIRGGAEKKQTGRFGLDLIKFGHVVEMLSQCITDIYTIDRYGARCAIA